MPRVYFAANAFRAAMFRARANPPFEPASFAFSDVNRYSTPFSNDERPPFELAARRCSGVITANPGPRFAIAYPLFG